MKKIIQITIFGLIFFSISGFINNTFAADCFTEGDWKSLFRELEISDWQDCIAKALPDNVVTDFFSNVSKKFYWDIGQPVEIGGKQGTIYFFINNKPFDGTSGITEGNLSNNYTAIIRENWLFVTDKVKDNSFLNSFLRFGGRIQTFEDKKCDPLCTLKSKKIPSFIPYTDELEIGLDNNDFIAKYVGACRCGTKTLETNEVVYDCELDTSPTSNLEFYSIKELDKSKITHCISVGSKSTGMIIDKYKINPNPAPHPCKIEKEKITCREGQFTIDHTTTKDSATESLVYRPINKVGEDDIIKVTTPKVWKWHRCGHKICILGACVCTETDYYVSANTYAMSSRMRLGDGSFTLKLYDISLWEEIRNAVVSLAAIIITIAIPGAITVTQWVWISASTLAGYAARFNNISVLMSSVPTAYGTVEQAKNNPESIGMCADHGEGKACWKWNWSPQLDFYPPTVELKTAKPVVELGEPITLTWKSENTSSCTASKDWSGNKTATTTYTSEDINKPIGNYNFNLGCTNGTATSTATTTASVVPLLNCSFTADPSEIDAGAQSTLKWTCKNATSCTLDEVNVNKSSGFKVVTPAQTTTYNLTCTRSTITKTFPATVVVGESDANWWETPWWEEILPR